MTKFIDFDTKLDSADSIPEHTQQAIEDYLVKGWSPGGFLEAMLSGDLFMAASNADFQNGPAMQVIALWLLHNAPEASRGNREQVKRWLSDYGGARSNYHKIVTQAYIMKTLMS